MTQNEIKQIRSLQIKKFRDELNLFVAEGDKCISELSKVFTLVQHFSADNTPLKDIERASSLRTPQGSIAVFRKPLFPLPVIQPDTLYLALDGIQDPGNLGTIIRTADWFGIRDIICSANTADCFSPKVVQATMGALARVRVHYIDLPAWLTNAQHSTLHTALADRSRRSRDKNTQPSTLHTALADRSRRSRDKNSQPSTIYGTLLTGKDLYAPDAIPDKRSGIIVMGNEGNGLSPEVRKLITHSLRIPSFPPDAPTSESLNVAIATAIILAHFRQPDPIKL